MLMHLCNFFLFSIEHVDLHKISYSHLFFYSLHDESSRIFYSISPIVHNVDIFHNDDENENDAWTECPELIEANEDHILNPSSVNNTNYLLRHRNTNANFNESSSSDALDGNPCTIMMIFFHLFYKLELRLVN